MNRKEFESELDPATHTALRNMFRGNESRMNLLFETASATLISTDIRSFETFADSPGFRTFIRKRKTISGSRFEQTMTILLKRIAYGIDPATVAGIAGEMGGDRYRAAERIYFMVPVDRAGYEIFESGFVTMGEQNIDLLGEYIEFCLSGDYIFFKADYRENPALFNAIFKRLIILLLARKNHESLKQAARFLITDYIMSFIQGAESAGRLDEFIDLLFDVFHHSSSIDTFFSYLKAFSLRYRSVSGSNERLIQVRHARLMDVWKYFLVADMADIDDFKEFVSMYGNSLDEFETFIWNIVFSLENSRIVKAIAILVSTAFNSLKGFYSNDRAIIKFLVKNIISAIAELDIKNFTSPLYGIVLKLFLGLKLNRGFIRRRADFFAWLKTCSSSLRIEMEVIRFMFFEYIYIALKIVPGGTNVRITKCSDERHRLFVDIIDSLPQGRTKVNEKEFSDGYRKILAMLREYIWSGNLAKFPDDHHTLYDLKNISESLDSEDEIITALESIHKDDLKKYSDALTASFRNNPDRAHEAVQEDFWYRILLADALPYCQSVLIPVVGTMEIKESEGGACTDGRAIYLPGYISYFRDNPEPLIDNRNLTVYIGYTLHEAGHIAGGSYHFNLSAFLEKVKKPELLRTIMNFFEDFRIELFLIKIRAHFQIKDILQVTNEYLTMLHVHNFTSLSFDFLLYIFDEAGGYNTDFKSDPDYIKKTDYIMNADMNTGRFRGMKELADYGISRLQNMDVANPLAAYPLAREFYDIMEQWPDPDLAGVADRHGLYEGDSSQPGEKGDRTPLTREQLDELYRMYNDNPAEFLRSRGFRVFPSLLDNGREGNEDDSAGGPFDDMVSGMLGYSAPDYESGGTIDFSTRTKADDEIARAQTGTRGKKDKDKKKKDRKKTEPKKKETEKKAEKPEEKNKKKYVYGIDSRTGSRTKLSEIKEFTVKGTDRVFMKKFRKWEYLAGVIEQQLAVIIPTIDESVEFSSLEGDLDIDRLIEALSDKNLVETSPEIFEVRDEQKRSLEISIGLDASGSTALHIDRDGDTILDIEKVFAIIFGRALGYLTERVNVYAFNSLTSTNIYRADRVDSTSMFMSDAANRDGDFIRYITDLLKHSDAEVKYFFMLSDGQPCSDNYDGKEALDDTLIAMREAVHSGIKLIYFNFDSIKRDYFDLFQAEATYARYFKSPEEILSAVPEMLRTVADSIK